MSDDAKQIRILTVDDHPVLRQGIAALVAVRSYLMVLAWRFCFGDAGPALPSRNVCAMPRASTACVKFEDRRLAIVYKHQPQNAAAIDRY